MRAAKSRKMSRSARASPGGSTALSDRWTVRSALVRVPVFSPQVAAGSTTSASWAVSVRNRSWATTKSRSWVRIERIRASSGRDTAGLVPVIHSIRSVPCSAYRNICIAWVGGA